MKPGLNQNAKLIFALIAVGALARLILATRLSPLLIDPSYTDSARDILTFHFRALGDRAPTYPLLLALCGNNFHVVWLVQSLLGIAASVMIFDMAFRYTGRGSVALATGILSSLIRDPLIWEAYIATEALAGFLLVACFWLTMKIEESPGASGWKVGALGAVLALGGLNRPLMLCVIPVFFIFLFPSLRPAQIFSSQNLRNAAVFAAPIAVLVFGWCGFNYANSGFFSPTTRAGQQLMDPVTPYVQLAPDKYAVLRDVWLKNSARPHDVQEGIYEDSLPELEQRTGESEAQISHELAGLAMYLNFHHPLLWLRRAEDSWMQFWGEPTPAETQWPQGKREELTGFASPLIQFLIRQLMGVFLVLSLLSIPLAMFGKKVFSKFEYLIFAVCLWISVFSAFTEYGDNHRFSIPCLPMMMYVVVTWGWKCVTAVSTKPFPEA
jgi:hypothetical protein